MEVQSYLFLKQKGWTVEKDKEWFQRHPEQPQAAHERFYAVLHFQIKEKILENPLRIRSVALTAGMSRNFNI
jgi:hypothetical protein